MTDADRIATLEAEIGRLKRVVENVLEREVEQRRLSARNVLRSRPFGEGTGYVPDAEINRIRSARMERDGTVLTPVSYTRDTEQPYTVAEIARMTGGEAA